MGVHLRYHADGRPVLRVSRRHVGHRPQWLTWHLDALKARGLDIDAESCRLCVATTPEAMDDHDAAIHALMRRMGWVCQPRGDDEWAC